jgi:hypothetical protein
MKRSTFFLCATLTLLSMIGAAKADLIDYGLNNEMFFDTALNEYFYDPSVFQGQTRKQVDEWLGQHPAWRYAHYDELDQLLSYNLPIKDPAGTDWLIMGEPTSASSYKTASGSTRYSFMWSGWMTTYTQDPEFFPHYSYVDWGDITMAYNIPDAGQDGTYFMLRPGDEYGMISPGGAWLVTDHDPLSTPAPATLLLLGSGLLGLARFKRKLND